MVLDHTAEDREARAVSRYARVAGVAMLLTAIFGTLGEMVLPDRIFASSLVLGDSPGMGTFSPDQRNALAYLAIRISGTIAWLFLCLYGIASMIRGYLIARSRYIPKIFGILFILGGAGFFLRTATYLLAPKYSSPLLLMPMALAVIPTMVWLLIRGIDPARVRA